MSIMLGLMLTFFVSNIGGFKCPDTQTVDTHLICQIFDNTNIQSVVDIDFNDDDYCKSDSIYIRCNPITSTIDVVEMEIIGLNGEIDLSNGWPLGLTIIDLEQNWDVRSALFGDWDWNSLKEMNQLWKIDIQDNWFSNTLNNNDWNILAALPSLTDLTLVGNYMNTDFSQVTLNSVSNIEYLELSYNNFYGTMDVSTNGFIGKFPQLIFFWLAHNSVQGYFNNLNVFSSYYVPYLKEISIEHNLFSGQLIMTNSLKFSDSLEMFEIDYNEFSGDIDWSIFNHLYLLEEFDISDNAFTGKIDWDVISNLANNGVLNKIHLKNNSFTGYADFSWMPSGYIDFSLDIDIQCDPVIYPCIGGVKTDRTKIYCYSKSECESSCQCTTISYTTSKPTKTPILTKHPTPSPTKLPTKNPTLSPTKLPIKLPTKNPTHLPTKSPIKLPTKLPTAYPTRNPTTSRPTTSDQLFCGDFDTGLYSGLPLLFNVQLNYFADLTFNAEQSSFNVTSMEAYSKLNVLLATDVSNGEFDESITLLKQIPGDYKFYIQGDKSGVYNIQITCTSQTPTASPTNNLTLSPSFIPTTMHPISSPLKSTTTGTIIMPETINHETTDFSFLGMHLSNWILIWIVIGLLCIIWCMLVLVILVVNNHYKRKDDEHESHDVAKPTIDNFHTGIDYDMNFVMKQLPPAPAIVQNNNLEDIWNDSLYNEGVELPNLKYTVNEPVVLQNNNSTNTEMESMYGSFVTPQHPQMDENVNENYNLDKENDLDEEYEYEYYYD